MKRIAIATILLFLSGACSEESKTSDIKQASNFHTLIIWLDAQEKTTWPTWAFFEEPTESLYARERLYRSDISMPLENESYEAYLLRIIAECKNRLGLEVRFACPVIYTKDLQEMMEKWQPEILHNQLGVATTDKKERLKTNLILNSLAYSVSGRLISDGGDGYIIFALYGHQLDTAKEAEKVRALSLDAKIGKARPQTDSEGRIDTCPF